MEQANRKFNPDEWVSETSSGCGGFRNTVTQEWIYLDEFSERKREADIKSEVEIAAENYTDIQCEDVVNVMPYHPLEIKHLVIETFKDGWEANPAKYTEKDIEDLFEYCINAPGPDMEYWKEQRELKNKQK